MQIKFATGQWEKKNATTTGLEPTIFTSRQNRKVTRCHFATRPIMERAEIGDGACNDKGRGPQTFGSCALLSAIIGTTWFNRRVQRNTIQSRNGGRNLGILPVHIWPRRITLRLALLLLPPAPWTPVVHCRNGTRLRSIPYRVSDPVPSAASIFRSTPDS